MQHAELTEELQAELTLLALGARDEAAARQWQTHVADCPVCRQELAQLNSMLASLAYDAPPVAPPAYLKTRLFMRLHTSAADLSKYIGEDTPVVEAHLQGQPMNPSPHHSIHRAWKWGLATVLVAAMMLIGFGVYITSLLRNIETQRQEMATLKTEIARQQDILALFKSPHVSIVVMNGLAPSPQGHGKMIWDATSQKALLYVTNLPPAPDDKEYQLWRIVDNRPVSAGVFALSTEGGGFFQVEPVQARDIQHIHAFAVTLEPKGGLPQPTGPMFLLGKTNL